MCTLLTMLCVRYRSCYVYAIDHVMINITGIAYSEEIRYTVLVYTALCFPVCMLFPRYIGLHVTSLAAGVHSQLPIPPSGTLYLQYVLNSPTERLFFAPK